jgi:hypothetical protein
LVNEPEKQIKQLLSHIGVAFEPSCLSFHQFKRVVRTASSEQVRQAINTKGIGIWRNVEAHYIEQIANALGNMRGSIMTTFKPYVED